MLRLILSLLLIALIVGAPRLEGGGLQDQSRPAATSLDEAAAAEETTPGETAPANEAPPADGIALPRVRVEALRSLLEVERQRLEVPGLSAAVVLDDQLAWSAGLGVADLEHNSPATPRTVYALDSVSTPITAVAVLRRVERGELALHTNVRKYVPEWPAGEHPILIRHLLAHQSGIRSLEHRDEYHNRTAYETLKDTLAILSEKPLRAAPGDRFLVSPFAYNLLGLVLERLEGERLSVCLDKDIFAPTGMNDTRVDNLRAIIPGRAGMYVRETQGKLERVEFHDPSNRPAAGGIISTVEDLARFAGAIMSHQLLSPEMTTVMATPNRLNNGKETAFGLGWYVGEHAGHHVLGYSSRGPRSSVTLLLLPEQHAAVVLTTNLERIDLIPTAQAVLDLLVPAASPDQPK
jgi:CubicO group peptidase (beta-lactamase class C family)